MFGTCGIRKIYSSYDKSEKTFTPSMAVRLGLALGTFLDMQGKREVIIGRDVRTTSKAIEYALVSGLMSSGCKVFTIGMVTTPTLCMSIDFLRADLGVMITASHNPPQYIGVKLFGPGGLGLSPEEEQSIEKIYQDRSFMSKAWYEQGSVSEVQRINETHVKKILKKTKFKATRNIKVLVDPGNGSGSHIGPMLLNRMGLKYITLNSQPDGTFPGRYSEPSEKNLKYLRHFVATSHEIDLGIAFDGDADRVVFVDETGLIIEPIRVLTFLAREYVKDKYPDPTKRINLSVATPVNSSGVIEHVLEPLGVKVYRTKVGDINVSLTMNEHHGFMGGENCGVYIQPEFSGHNGPDTLMAIVLLLKYLGKYDVKISELLEEIPEFSYSKGELHLKHDQIFSLENYKNIRDELIPLLENSGFSSFQETYVDGLHIRFNSGWILIRKSGTTPIMRLTVEGHNDAVASKIQEIGEKVIKKLIDIVDSD
ncbi:Phosphoglucomutase/phosphomannomutase [Candidatus Lokiarchaeum ossiferum]|uniref:Phosphoglucomutase/phosphomannomutase n=1 Tax=Candidatus Lokiarchaeum ossiferum TaxID=2951803 RepID=A0ABY6I0Y3_9ARCH|nr:Phosphoglucomutase/phosphomannomutase [Candidatus Lokiarchaeum sp. B-35]